MAKFLTGNQLNAELENLFERAEQQLTLISPFIKLHDRYISTLKTKIDNPNLQLVIVFGKNEEDYSRSMKQEDFSFFKEFPNIEIRYEKRLHAKYYASEHASLLTSMNLYMYSQDHNIEAGIMMQSGSLIGDLANNIMGEESIDLTADEYFNRVIEQAELLFKKTPEYETIMLGLSKKYKSSRVEVDKLSDFFSKRLFNVSPSVSSPPQKVQTYESKKINLAITEKTDSNSLNSSSSNANYISTSSLAKEIGVPSKALFSKFESLNWIQRKDDNWIITNIGKSKGAQLKKSQYGDYIAWPKSIISEVAK